MDECTPDVRVIWVELRFLRTLIEATRQGDMRALELQAREYERRLKELNNSHQTAAERYSHFVPRDLHDREFARVDKEAASLSRLVWVGVGIVLIGEIILWVMLNHVAKTL